MCRHNAVCTQGTSQTAFAAPRGSNLFLHVMGGVSTALLAARKAGLTKEKEHPVEPKTVGVIICAYNEERNIGSLLAALTQERVNEIIVVASGCTDRTVEIVRKFQQACFKIKLIIEEERKGKTSAINLALRRATSDYLVFLPADVRPTIGSVSTLVDGFKPEVGIRVGRPIPVGEASGIMGRLSKLIWILHNRTLQELSSEGTLEHASGEFYAIKRNLACELPLDVVNDDAYMAVAVKRAGFKIDYEDTAVAFMRGPGTVSDYVSQRRRVHFGHMQVMKSTGAYPTVFESQALARPALVLRILREELQGLKGGMRALTMGIVLEFIALTLSGVDRIARRNHILWRMVDSTKTLSGPVLSAAGVSLGTGGLRVSRLYVYPEQSLDRSFRSGSTLGQLSPRLEVAALRPYMCY